MKKHIVLFLLTLTVGSSMTLEAATRLAQNINQQLITAVMNGRLERVNALLVAPGINVNFVNNDGMAALHFAVRFDHLDIMNALLGAGADVNALGQHGRTALYFAAKFGHLGIVNALLRAGADVNDARNNDAITALHWAAQNGYLEIVKVLLAQPGINVNVADRVGMTALHWAARNGHLDIVNALLGAGADVTAVSHAGLNALQEAELAAVVDAITEWIRTHPLA
jgi:ankyrin repeat protein